MTSVLKSLNFVEFNSYIHWSEQLLLGAQLQDIWTNDHHLVLEFYKFRTLWLVCDLNNRSPQIILIQNQIPPVAKKTKPLSLFLHSHGKNLRVEGFKSRPELGRAATLKLSNREKSCVIEMQMVPNSANILVISGKLKISWEKPRELPEVPNPTSETLPNREEEWLQRESDWLKTLTTGSAKSIEKKDFSRALEKKRKALMEIESRLDLSAEKKWSQLGEMLKLHQDLPSELQTLMNEKLSRSENMERAFQKAKDLIRKRQGTIERIKKLKNEIDLIESSGGLPPPEKKSSGSRSLEKAHARGRKLQLGNGIEAVCGRSGKDNLAILRQARAWDLWLHLKDYPGAHAIIFREKNATVDVAQIEKAAQWLIQESSAAKGAMAGVKYDVVVAETRFVRPIKGDSLGRVNYQNPTVYTFASKGKRL